MWPTNIYSWLSYVRKVALPHGRHHQSKAIYIISASAAQFTILYNHFFPFSHDFVNGYSSINYRVIIAPITMTIAIIIKTNMWSRTSLISHKLMAAEINLLVLNRYKIMISVYTSTSTANITAIILQLLITLGIKLSHSLSCHDSLFNIQLSHY